MTINTFTKYFAVMKLSGSDRVQERTFISRETAEAYIRDQCCKTCKTDTDAGWYADQDEIVERVKSVLDTGCGAEYDIEEIDHEEYMKRFTAAMAELHEMIRETPWEEVEN